MDGHYIHLLSNHFPIILCIVGFIVLTVGLLKHQKQIKQVGLFILVAASLATIPTYISGEEAEHKVEHFAGTSESSIEEHEEAAEFAFIICDIIGVLSFISILLLHRNHPWSLWTNRIVWAIAILSIITLFKVGQSGGQIRRPELRSDANSTETTPIPHQDHE